MENENNYKEININLKNDLYFDYIYNLDYAGQNLDNNKGFENWKKTILNKFGNDVKLFRCNEDKILFYTKYEQYISYPGYFVKCPICKKYICYFCCYSSHQITYIRCCLKRSISIMLFIDGNKYINKSNNKYPSNYIEYLIPGFNLVNIFFKINNILFCNVGTKKSKINNNGILKISDKIENEIYIRLIYLIPFLLFIPFFVLNAYFIIFLFFISIIFKYYPLKYYYGIIDET